MSGLTIIETGRELARSYAAISHQAACKKDLNLGQKLHSLFIKTGLPNAFPFLDNNIINMYAKCQEMDFASKVFDEMHDRNVVSWTAMISGYSQDEKYSDAIHYFIKMKRVGIRPNDFTMPCVVMSSGRLASPRLGRQLHTNVVKTGLESNSYVCGSMVDMYAKCGILEDAFQVFDDMLEKTLAAWNALIAGHVDDMKGREALALFCRMRAQGTHGNNITFSSVINACVACGGIQQGKQLHAHVVKCGLLSESNVSIELVNFYGKICSGIEARRVLDEMPVRSVVAWSSLMAGYVKSGDRRDAVNTFCEMLREGILGNMSTFASIFKACAGLAGLEQGRQIHVHAIKTRYVSNVLVGGALVYMYARSGSISDACHMFELMPEKSIGSWNAMLAGLAQHGQADKVLQLFEQMKNSGYSPNNITFVCVLSACKNGGLVKAARSYFESMALGHGIEPTVEHYSCMVDLLSHTGHLEEARELINNSPVQPNTAMYGALLHGCRVHGDMELGKWAAERLFEVDPYDCGSHVILSNIYAAAGQWDDVVKVRRFMKDMGM